MRRDRKINSVFMKKIDKKQIRVSSVMLSIARTCRLRTTEGASWVFPLEDR